MPVPGSAAPKGDQLPPMREAAPRARFLPLPVLPRCAAAPVWRAGGGDENAARAAAEEDRVAVEMEEEGEVEAVEIAAAFVAPELPVPPVPPVPPAPPPVCCGSRSAPHPSHTKNKVESWCRSHALQLQPALALIGVVA